MNSFLRNENEIRVSKYAKCSDDEEFLVRLNAELTNLEESMCSDVSPDIPNIYIFGLPRSGTTLLYQLIAHTLDVAWPTNLMARFWKAPVVGMRLSKILGLFDERVDFNSSYGVTKGVNGPHEFGYFWMKWLNYKDSIQKTREHEEIISWAELHRKLNSISKEAGKSVVYKNLLYSFHLERFMQIQKDSLFIYCQRNLSDVATSILLARKQRYHNEKVWWSAKPHDYVNFLDKDPNTQIVFQVKSLSSYFNNVCKTLPKGQIREITYENLNNEFGNLVNWISETLSIPRKSEYFSKIAPNNYSGMEEYKVFNNLLRE